MRSIKPMLAVAATAVLLMGVVGAGFCAATLHVPRRVGPAPRNTAKVELAAKDKTKLAGWWIRSVEPNGNCVMVLHGNGDSRAGSVGFAPMFLEQGYSVLAPDSRAHGESGGEFVTYGLLERYDVVGWAHWMKDQGCHKVYGLGESLGASILIQAAAVEPVFAAIVAESAYAELREIAVYRVNQQAHANSLARFVVWSGIVYANWRYGLDFDQVSPVRSIAQISVPILLIHGLKDFRTPPSNSQALAAANPRASLWLPPKAEHTGAASAEPAEFRRRVLDWFARN